MSFPRRHEQTFEVEVMSDPEDFGRTADQIVDVQVPEIMEDAVGKMIRLAPGERIQVSNVAFIDVPVSQATEEITGVAKRISEGELRNGTVEQLVASFMPRIQDEIVETIRCIPHRYSLQQIATACSGVWLLMLFFLCKPHVTRIQ